MTNLDNFTPEKQTNDFRPDVLSKRPRKRFIFKLPSLTMPVLIIVVGVLLVAGFGYSSACFQALLQHQVDMVQAQNKPFVELAKRVGNND